MRLFNILAMVVRLYSVSMDGVECVVRIHAGFFMLETVLFATQCSLGNSNQGTVVSGARTRRFGYCWLFRAVRLKTQYQCKFL